MTAHTKMSETFEIKIPEEVRQAHNWRPGQDFVFVPRDGAYLLVPVPEAGAAKAETVGRDPGDAPKIETVDDLRGILRRQLAKDGVVSPAPRPSPAKSMEELRGLFRGADPTFERDRTDRLDRY